MKPYVQHVNTAPTPGMNKPPRFNRFSRSFTSAATKIARPFHRLVTVHPRSESQKGFSTAVVSGEWIFVSAHSGYDQETREISPIIEEQAEQAFLNIQASLAEAGASIDDIVRVRYVLKDRGDWRDCWPVLRKWLGNVRPASSVMQAVLMDDNMRIEIEVTARKTGMGGYAGGI